MPSPSRHEAQPRRGPGRADARHRDRVPGRQGPRRRRLPAAARRGARPDGRERRREVDADQSPDRGVRHRRRHDHRPRPRAGLLRAGRGPGGRDRDRVPGGQPLPEPHGRGEHPARARAAAVRPDRPARRPRRRAVELLARLNLQPRPRLGARRPPAGRAAAGGDRPGRRHRRRGARSSTSRRPASTPARSASCSGSSATCATPGSRCCSSRTSSSRSTRSPTAPRSCATAGWSASTRSPRCRGWRWSSKMIGHELAVLERPRPRAARPTSTELPDTPFLAATGDRPHRRDRPGRPRACTRARCSGWPGCSGPVARSWPGCCSGPTTPTPAPSTSTGRPVRLRSPLAAIAERIAFCSEDRKGEGVDRRPHGAGQHRARAAGPPRLGPPAAPAHHRRAGRQRWISALDIRPADPDALRPQPVRRQPAEGACWPAG